MIDKPSPVAYARGCDVLSVSLIPLESPPDAAITGCVGIESHVEKITQLLKQLLEKNERESSMGKISYLISVMLHYLILREEVIIISFKTFRQ